ncbi:MAG: choice-of-anchor D domain-containing protein, partial [Anaerolineae bacterium]|nr:choice-of-anchor D domain-containing protein [Anaerolineae bacterium]
GYGSVPAPSSTINVGSALVGSTTSTTLVVSELGTADLTVDPAAGGMLTGPDAVDFALVGAPPFVIVDGGPAVTITIECTPSAEGARAAVLSFDTNDPAQPTVTYNLACTGTVPGEEPVITVFDPALSKVGALQPGQLGLPGEQLTWIIVVTNQGSVTGTDITIVDTLVSELRIDSVETDRGTFTISGQTVTFFIPFLAPGESVGMRINTTVLSSPLGGVLVNTTTLSGSGQTRTATATIDVPSSLPGTGYPPAGGSDGPQSTAILLIGAGLMVAGLCSVVVWRFRRKRIV